MNSLLTDVTLL